jgi:hypothetical protein
VGRTNVDIEFALLGEARECEIAGTKKASDGIVMISSETKVELGMKRVPEM